MRRKGWLIVVAVGLAAITIILGWWIYHRSKATLPPGILTANGRLEGRTVRVSSETGGRITRLAVEKGDRLVVGQLIAQLDRREVAAGVDGARAAVAAADAAVLEATQRATALEAQLGLARTEAARYGRLAAQEAAPRQAAEQAATRLASLESERAAALAARVLAIRQGELARAQLRAAEVRLDEATVTAPVAGIVTAEFARAGEMLGPGMPVIEIMSEDRITLRVFLALADAERMRPGLDARVYVDAFPGRPFSGTVERVASQAEFTPKDVYMPEDRTTLVMAVDLRIANADETLKDGFPADAYIRWVPGAHWPERPPWR